MIEKLVNKPFERVIREMVPINSFLSSHSTISDSAASFRTQALHLLLSRMTYSAWKTQTTQFYDTRSSGLQAHSMEVNSRILQSVLPYT